LGGPLASQAFTGTETGMVIASPQITNPSATGLTPNRVAVASDFTTANNTSLQTITGLSWSLPAVAANYSFHCSLSYSIATATVGMQFGIQAATNNPTNIFATGTLELSLGPPFSYATGTLATLNTTTATAITGGTPGATGTLYGVELNGTIENPAVLNTINIMVDTTNGADAVTVKRGSFCYLF
jgi:hypothetical protein